MTDERLKEIKDELAGYVCDTLPFDIMRRWVAIGHELLAEVEDLRAEKVIGDMTVREFVRFVCKSKHATWRPHVESTSEATP